MTNHPILRSSWVLSLAVMAGAGPAMAAEVFTLDQYLNQVKSGHGGYRAAEAISAGALDRAAEGSLLLSPAFFANATLSSDKKETTSATFQGDRTVANSYTVGLSKLTTFGLSAKLSYNVTYAHVYGVNPMFVPQPSFHDARPALELSQSLWRNGFGREVRATQEVLEAQALASSYGERFRMKMTLAEAELAYWRLALAREAVIVQKDTLARAEKIRDWNARRANLQLADRSDLLQAEAALAGRRLELQAAIDEESAASRGFNTARGLGEDRVAETLEPFDQEAVARLKTPIREGLREDLKAAEQAQRLAKNNAAAARERNLPTLDVFASAALNGRDPDLRPSMSDSFQTQHSTLAAGVRFSVPLDLGTIKDARAGYAQEMDGADLAYQRKAYEQERDWDDLTVKLEQAKVRLSLARKIETAQKEKLGHERERLNRGRTVTFQVLMFEQDYEVAQLSRIRAQADILRIVAQMKTFGASS